MGEARRRTTPKVLGCTADKTLPRACQTNSSPAEQWFPPQAAHLAAFPFFQAASSLPGSPFPQASSQRATWSHFLRVSNNIQPHVCSFPESSQRSITSVQGLLSVCHLSSPKFSFLLLQVLSFSPCLLSPPRCASNFKALFQLPFTPCHILLILMLPLLILGILPFALLLLLLILR